MTTSSEDVLLSVPEVRNKKTDGTIYLMTERIAWMPNGKDTFTISHKYADIKMQKISPEGKNKIQLQVVLYNNEATTFHFVHKDGVERQLKDRNDIKEMLQKLLPKFKQKISKELEEKNRVLSEDANLFQLYKDLVVSQVISAEEFWKQIAPIRCPSLLDVISVNNSSGGGGTGDDRPNFLMRSAKQNLQQSIGISPAFLADIKPQPDGANGIRYNITTDIIEAIFRTYPAVQQKHFDNVPHKMSEQEFWTRFFQSHYFHRDRVLSGVGSTSTKTDLFADCAQDDDQHLKMIASKKMLDSFTNLDDFDDTEYLHRPAEDDLHHHQQHLHSKKDAEKKDDTGGGVEKKKKRERDKDVQLNPMLTANQALIKRFNHHSIMVLEATSETKQDGSRKATTTTRPPPPSSSSSVSIEEDPNQQEQEAKRKKIQQMNEYEDLNERCLIDAESWVTDGTKDLNLVNKERYLAGPISNHIDSGDMLSSSASASSLQSMIQLNSYQEYLLSRWNNSLANCLTFSEAIKAVQDFSPGGSLFAHAPQSNLVKDIPPDTQKELKQLYFSGNELLRHFWSCFPVTSERLEEKLIQMKQTLERYQFTKLIPFQDKLQRDKFNSKLTLHLTTQIQNAFNKFNSWQLKKASLSRKIS